MKQIDEIFDRFKSEIEQVLEEQKKETVHVHADNVVIHSDEEPDQPNEPDTPDEPNEPEEPKSNGILGRNWTQKKVFDHSEFDETKRLKAVGWAEYDGDLYLMINSSPRSGSMSQTGSLIRTSDLETFEFIPNVLDETDQPWQGTQRVMPSCLFFDGEKYNCYFIDKPDSWGGAYWGGRGVGIATSKNLRDWEYHPEPAFTAETFYNLTGKGDKNDLKRRGTFYSWGGWYHKGYHYLFMNGSIEGGESFDRICVRHKGDLNWELVEHDYKEDSAPIQVGEKWYNAGKFFEPERHIAIFESDHMLKGYKHAEKVAVKDPDEGGEVHPQLIAFNGRYAVTWSQWDETRKKQSLYIAVSY